METTSIAVNEVDGNTCGQLQGSDTSACRQVHSPTKDAVLDTPSKLVPLAQQSDEPRSATDWEESRLATPRSSQDIDKSTMSADCVVDDGVFSHMLNVIHM